MQINYQPKGGMCMSCVNKHKDCSTLDFKSMPIIDKSKDVIIVRCAEFNRDNTGE